MRSVSFLECAPGTWAPKLTGWPRGSYLVELCRRTDTAGRSTPLQARRSHEQGEKEGGLQAGAAICNLTKPPTNVRKGR